MASHSDFSPFRHVCFHPFGVPRRGLNAFLELWGAFAGREPRMPDVSFVLVMAERMCGAVLEVLGFVRTFIGSFPMIEARSAYAWVLYARCDAPLPTSRDHVLISVELFMLARIRIADLKRQLTNRYPKSAI